MKLRSMKSRLKLAQGVALVGAIIVVGTLVLEPGALFGGIALAQNPDPAAYRVDTGDNRVDAKPYADRWRHRCAFH